MSSDELHRRSRRFKSQCASFREGKALFRYRREVRADADHTLCFECYRGEINRARARRLHEVAMALELWQQRTAAVLSCSRN